ncbi:MAG: DNA helicase PriA [Methanomicrobiales archaeon]|nr:DNA helicase PriA [Methanomicrobiales archaeon]
MLRHSCGYNSKIICKKCGTELLYRERAGLYCPACGRRVSVICPGCGKVWD